LNDIATVLKTTKKRRTKTSLVARCLIFKAGNGDKLTGNRRETDVAKIISFKRERIADKSYEKGRNLKSDN